MKWELNQWTSQMALKRWEQTRVENLKVFLMVRMVTVVLHLEVLVGWKPFFFKFLLLWPLHDINSAVGLSRRSASSSGGSGRGGFLPLEPEIPLQSGSGRWLLILIVTLFFISCRNNWLCDLVFLKKKTRWLRKFSLCTGFSFHFYALSRNC